MAFGYSPVSACFVANVSRPPTLLIVRVADAVADAAQPEAAAAVVSGVIADSSASLGHCGPGRSWEGGVALSEPSAGATAGIQVAAWKSSGPEGQDQAIVLAPLGY